jgi:peptide/nickel transport system substrate-binding protein
VAARTDAEAIAESELKSIGIDLVAVPLPTGIFFGPTALPAGNFDIAEFGSITSGDPGDWYDAWRCGGPSNYTGYCSDKATALMRAGNSELDQAKRAADFEAADTLMAATVPVLPLYQRPTVLAYRSKIAGMVDNPSTFGPVWNIEDWRWMP